MTRTRNNRRRSSASRALNSAPAIAPKSGLNRGQGSGVGIQPREDNYQEHSEVDEPVMNHPLQNQENRNEVVQQFAQICQQKLQERRLEEERVRKHERFMLFLRCDPPKFDGECDAEKAEAWIAEVEKVFRVMRCDEVEQLEYAVFQLQGVAYDWWRPVKQRWDANNTPVTWMNFVEEFRGRFVPQVVRCSWAREFIHLTQGSSSVFEYDAHFIRLLPYMPDIMNDERLMTRCFIQGLRPEIQSAPALEEGEVEEYKQAVRIAMEVEAVKKEIETLKRKAQTPLAGKPKVEARAYAFKG